MNKTEKGLKGIAVRYLLLVLFAFPGLGLFYLIFTPLTVYPVFWLLGIPYLAVLGSPTIIVLNNAFPIELISACIAGAAYYLLLILNLSIPNIKIDKRIKMVLSSFLIFLALNIIRIFILSIMAYSGSSLFGITHQVFWYLLSTIFVVAIWFGEVKYFKVKEIPFYSDLKFLYHLR